MEALQNLDYPSEKEDWWLDVLIGGLISMIPIFNFVAFGYMVDAMLMGMRNSRQVPTWDDMGGKFVNGFWFFVITLAYGLIPMAVFVVFLLPVVIEAVTRGDVSTVSGVSAGIGFLVFMLLLLAAVFLMPMAVARWVATGSVGQAFKVGALLGDIKAVLADYVVAWLLMVILGSIVVSLLSWLPVVNMMAYFYWSVAFYNYFGKLYSRAGDKIAFAEY